MLRMQLDAYRSDLPLLFATPPRLGARPLCCCTMQKTNTINTRLIELNLDCHGCNDTQIAGAPVAGAGGANGDVDCCSAGVVPPGVMLPSAAIAGLSTSSGTGNATGRGRLAAVTGNRTRGVDIGDGDRGRGALQLPDRHPPLQTERRRRRLS